jgi:hypothetical protein
MSNVCMSEVKVCDKRYAGDAGGRRAIDESAYYTPSGKLLEAWKRSGKILPSHGDDFATGVVKVA